MNERRDEAFKGWTSALRSGDYQPITGALGRRVGEVGDESSVGYCCLGVVCEVEKDNLGIDIKFDDDFDEVFMDGEEALLPIVVVDLLEISGGGDFNPKRLSDEMQERLDDVTPEAYHNRDSNTLAQVNDNFTASDRDENVFPFIADLIDNLVLNDAFEVVVG